MRKDLRYRIIPLVLIVVTVIAALLSAGKH